MLNDAALAHHRLKVDALLGSLDLRVGIHLSAAWTVLFGPSGSGKSTLLRATCGLLQTGLVEFSGRTGKDADWVDIETQRRSMPPHLRSIAYAPQGAVLFPHLTVFQNVSFASTVGRGRAGDSGPVGYSGQISEALETFDLTALRDRLPRELSGGERQRVNLARAFAVPKPRLLLLDEPFTGIDRATRERLIPLLRERAERSRVPVLSVTHDVEEALLLGAEVIRMEAGHIAAQGPADEVLAAERASIVEALRG